MKTLCMTLVSMILSASIAESSIVIVPDQRPTIQSAIDTVAPGDTVLVEPGVYFENIDFLGKAIVVGSRFLLTGDRSFISDTIVDGNSLGPVVRFENGEGTSSALVGMTLTHGNWDYGGGIVCVQSSPTLRDLIVTENEAIGGGGIHCSDHSNPWIEDVVIRDNAASITGSGGGLRCAGYSSPILRNVSILGNTALHGGGVYAYLYCHPTLIDVEIAGNTATSSTPSSPTGGGLNCGAFSEPRLVNVAIVNNTVGSATNLSGFGGGVACISGSAPILSNVTIAENVASAAGGGLYCLGNAAPILVNSILWGDSPQEVYVSGSFDPSQITLSYSDVRGGEAGIVLNENGSVDWLAGNIEEDPAFVDPGSMDYTLRPDSPCIDAGTAFFVAEGDTIIDLRPEEYSGSAPDMGAFEFFDVASVEETVSASGLLLRSLGPNPFAARTVVSYSLTEGAVVDLDVYDIRGRRVDVLVSGWNAAGTHHAVFDAQDLPSGTYVLQLRVNRPGSLPREATSKLLLVR